jgi:hypothetical protein
MVSSKVRSGKAEEGAMTQVEIRFGFVINPIPLCRADENQSRGEDR